MKQFIAPVLLLSASNAYAGSAFFKNFVVVDQGSGDAYYDTVGSVGTTFDFNNLDLGSYCPSGTPLYLSGGEANTYENFGDFIDNTQLIWTTYEAGNRPFSPFFSNIFLNFQSLSFNYPSTDKLWQTTGVGIDLTSGVGPGTYALEVYFEGQGNNSGFYYTIFDSNGGFNYVATYTVIDDPDGDCIDANDNCPSIPNADQADSDSDGIGDACDVCPGGNDAADSDSDGVCDALDICPGSPDEFDADADGVPDGCDTCPLDNPDDSDGDGICDTDDVCTGFDDTADADADGIADGCDACPLDNPNDSDADGVCESADACPGFDDNADADGDGVADGCDACPGGNDSADSDADGVCDFFDVCPGSDDNSDADGDTVPDGCDACPFDAADDSDSDGVCDSDDTCQGFDDNADADGDGVADGCDACPLDVTDDSDGDGVCDSDDVCAGSDDNADADSDGIADGCDNCPNDANPLQEDANSNGVGDACDATSSDSDGDGVPNADDLCPRTDFGVAVDADGCSGDQILEEVCPCDADWKNHGEYVSCVAQTSNDLVQDGLFSSADKDAAVSWAARSSCGKKNK